MASPRSATRRTPSSKASAPEATRAVYSPRLWPATIDGSTPRRSTASSTTRLATKVDSWALRVALSSSASACEQQVGDVTAGGGGGLVDQLPRRMVEPGGPHARLLGALAGEGERDHRCRGLSVGRPAGGRRSDRATPVRRFCAIRHVGPSRRAVDRVALVEPPLVGLDHAGSDDGRPRADTPPSTARHRRGAANDGRLAPSEDLDRAISRRLEGASAARHRLSAWSGASGARLGRCSTLAGGRGPGSWPVGAGRSRWSSSSGAGHHRGSSHGATRIFRLAYRDPTYVGLAVEALAAWRRPRAGGGASRSSSSRASSTTARRSPSRRSPPTWSPPGSRPRR